MINCKTCDLIHEIMTNKKRLESLILIKDTKKVTKVNLD